MLEKTPRLQAKSSPHEIPGLLALYVCYAAYIIIHDWICYFGGFDTTIWTYFGAFAVFATLLAIGVLWNRRTQSVRFALPELSRWDLLVLALFLCMFLIRVGRADSSADTWNYHIINQENPFRDYIGYDFFPGNRETSFPALADRMYYPFRLILGYRMGTILYTLLMMLTYLGVKQLVCKALPISGKISGRYEAILSLACGATLVTNFVGQGICSYYVDLFPLPLMLYLICEIVGGEETDRRGDVFLALCVGVVFGLKMSYAFLLLPLGVGYLWENRKRVTPALILLFGILGLLPILIYLINTWEQTGNPVFPLYNTIFHSPYITDQQNELMNGGGATGLLDGLLRPFWWAVASSNNASASGYLAPSDCRVTIGFVSSLILLILRIGEPEIRRCIRRMAALYIVMVYLTVFFIDAYPRLGLIIEPFGGVMTILLIALCWRSIRLPHLHKAVAGVMAVLMGTSVAYAGGLYLTNHFEYSWEYPVYSSNGARTRNGMSLLFRDRACTPEEQALADQVNVWLNFDVEAGAMRLLNETAPIVNVKYASYDSNRQAAADQLLQQYGAEGLYTVAQWASISGILEKMTTLGYHISGEIKMLHPYFSNIKLYLIPVEKSQAPNEYISLNDSAPASTKVIQEAGTVQKITGYAGLNSMLDTWDVDWQPITVRFTLISDETATVLAETTVEPDFEYHILDLPCNAQVNPGDQIVIEALNPDGNPYGYFVDLLNISFE